MDWDKLKVFHVAAEAGSFTHAGETLGLSQSAVSRQVSALETELRVPLFHRHARGLILTEQGELLYRTAHDVFLKLEAARAQLTDSREKPNGDLRVTTTMGLGTHWLTARVGEFAEMFPDIRIQLILTDDELDLAMREADVAIRMRQPVQPDLVQRKLFTVNFHAYASADYIKRHGQPRSLDELDEHRILLLGGPIPTYFQGLNWLEHAGRANGSPRIPAFEVNNVLGLRRAVECGVGIGTLPDYLTDDASSLVKLFSEGDTPKLEAYFTYAQEMRSVARIQVFRDFLISKAQRWSF
ncbi:LysR family transcriptional regulator [Xanthobacter sp. TB0139]|uniref:LysR family transcriptional regulator n=1 Tax=Xanthobacter sp. TB0139 TaxID=3459178 RepID=UPI00403A2C72